MTITADAAAQGLNAEQLAVLEASVVFVPLALFKVHANLAGDNKGYRTDRDQVEAAYCLPLFKAKWYQRAPRVTIHPLPKGTKPLDPMRRLSGKGDVPAFEAEEKRLSRMFGRAVFERAFPGDTFREAFARAARLTNPVGAEIEKKKDLAIRRSRAVARAVISVPADEDEAADTRAAAG